MTPGEVEDMELDSMQIFLRKLTASFPLDAYAQSLVLHDFARRVQRGDAIADAVRNTVVFWELE